MKSCSENINGFSFILHSTLVSFILANNLEPAEQAMLGVFLADIGSNLLSISAYNKYVEDKCENDTSDTDETNTTTKSPIKKKYKIPIKPIYKPPII